MHLILVGGFLGAGKTTLLHHAARRLTAQGHTVGLITNDQAPDLVDTALLTPAAAGIQEVAGSCFCCNFDGLMRAVDTLARAGATHIIAEPVGSCTDLSATILNPLKQLYPEIQLAPLTVLVDPQRLRDTLMRPATQLDADAIYIFRLQLQEADRILLTKSDTCSAADRDAALAWLAEEFPGTPVSAISMKDMAALDAWLGAVLAGGTSGARIVPVDYDRYAHGEAVLGWLNATYTLRWIDGLAPRWEDFARRFMTELHNQLREAAHEVGHVKLLLQAGPWQVAANLTALHAPYAFHPNTPEAPPALSATLTVNARVQTTPGTLTGIVQHALSKSAHGIVAPTQRTLHALQPGRPTPTHRYATVVA